MTDLDRLEKLAREATPGPWEWEPPSKDKWPTYDESLVTSWNEADGYPKSVVSGWGYDASGTSASDEDRAYIAAANPSVVLDLIARVKAAEAERDAYKARLDAVRAATAGNPKCDRYEEGDTPSCGWKRAYGSVLFALDGEVDGRWPVLWRCDQCGNIEATA